MDTNSLRIELIQTICRLPDGLLPQAAAALNHLEPTAATSSTAQTTGIAKDWPHAPLHRTCDNGTYMVTTGTYRKAHLFRDPGRLTLLEQFMLSLAAKYGWQLEAWAVFSNHYHYIAHSLSSPARLKEFLTELHANTAREINQLDSEVGRQVWHNFWDKKLTFEKSYLARLNYVHQNPVKHRLVRMASRYRWCSASWFERTATSAQVKTIYSFKTDTLKVTDDFEPLPIV